MRILPSKSTQGWSHEVRVLVTLYWLAHGLSYSVVSRAFHVPKSTVCRLVHTGVRKIAALRHEVIQQPTAGALDEVGQTFARLANSPVFARCVGSIDGCHVRIKTPPGPGGQDYLNRKLFPSIQLQAVCDGKGFFINTFVGYPGSVHDTRVLKNSRLYTAALYPPPVITTCAALHNICLTSGDILEPVEDVGDIGVVPPRPVRGERCGHGQRDRLAGLLSAPRVQPAELREHDYL
ncbi:hypothetical protein ABVT39_012045 [Epinephelus coioides]